MKIKAIYKYETIENGKVIKKQIKGSPEQIFYISKINKTKKDDNGNEKYFNTSLSFYA